MACSRVNFTLTFTLYVGNFKSCAHCACAASRMMQSLIFATVVSQTSVKSSVCVLAGYVVRVLQNGALKWKEKLTGVGLVQWPAIIH